MMFRSAHCAYAILLFRKKCRRKPIGCSKFTGVLLKTINEICRGKRGISAEMAMKLSKALGGGPQFWLNLQNNWEISQIAMV